MIMIIMDNSTYPVTEYETESPTDLSYVVYVDPYTVTPYKQILIAVFVTIFVIGFSGNVMVIFVIARNRSMRTVTNFFLGNLAFSDCLAMACSDIPILVTFVAESWPFGELICIGAYFLVIVTTTASILILVVISLERYMAILHPFEIRKFVTTKLLTITVCVIWVISVLLGVPSLFSYQTVEYDGATYCSIRKLNEHFYAAQSYARILLLYIMPLLIMCVLYGAIGRTLSAASPDAKFSQCNNKKNKKTKTATTSVGYKSTSSGITFGNLSPPQTPAKNGSNKHMSLLKMDPPSPAKVGPFLLEEPVDNDIAPSGDSDFMQDGNDNINSTRSKPAPPTPVHEITASAPSGRNWAISKSLRMPGCTRGKKNMSSTRGTKVRRRTEAVRAARRKAVRMLGIIVVCFALCLFPMQLMAFLETLNMTMGMEFALLYRPWFLPFTFACYFFNSALNPFLYAFLSNNFRKSFLETITCQTNRRRRGGTTKYIQRLKSVTSDANTEVVYVP